VKAKPGTVYDEDWFATPVYRWELSRPLTRKKLKSVIAESGLAGLTAGDDFIEAYYVGDPANEAGIAEFEDRIHRADRSLGSATQGIGRSVARLWAYGDSSRGLGFERVRGDVPAGTGVANKTAARVAGFLNQVKGKDGKPALGKVKAFQQADEITPKQRAVQERIAADFDARPDNDLKNPRVRKAYTELAKELRRQFNALPVKVEVFTGSGEPYLSSAAMRRDILDNNHLFVLATTPESFALAGADFSGLTLRGDARVADKNVRPLLYNDSCCGRRTISTGRVGRQGLARR